MQAGSLFEDTKFNLVSQHILNKDGASVTHNSTVFLNTFNYILVKFIDITTHYSMRSLYKWLENNQTANTILVEVYKSR